MYHHITRNYHILFQGERFLDKVENRVTGPGQNP